MTDVGAVSPGTVFGMTLHQRVRSAIWAQVSEGMYIVRWELVCLACVALRGIPLDPRREAGVLES